MFILPLFLVLILCCIGGSDGGMLKADCFCRNPFGNGCKIWIGPPTGYKCACVLIDQQWCEGHAIKCDIEEYCPGACTNHRCCLSGGGNCDGYDNLTQTYLYAKFLDQTLEYRLLYEPQLLGCNNETIIVLVNSKNTEFERRRSIRSHWSSQMKLADNRIRLIFVVNFDWDYDILRQLSHENRKFADILATSIIENYFNLTYKMYAAYSYLINKCPDSALTYHVDSDVIVNIPAFNDYCRNLIEASWFAKDKIFGNILRDGMVVRDKSHKKWYVPESGYAHKYYPSYVSGASYFLGRDVPKILIDMSPNVTFITVDDAFFTGIVAELANITRVHNDCIFSNDCDRNMCNQMVIGLHGCEL